MQPKVSLGQITVTENAATALGEAGQEVAEFLARHAQGDWGDLSAYEKEENDHGLAEGGRVLFLSAYPLKTNQTIWVFTNLKRGKTTVMLPNETLRCEERKDDMRRRKLRWYLVARCAGCIICVPHNWKAFRDPGERDCMSPCIRVPVYAIEAPNKRGAVAQARERYAADLLKAGEVP